jgi:hypothetical protein
MKILTVVATSFILSVGLGAGVASAQYYPPSSQGYYGHTGNWSGAERIVRQAYLDILGREPDRSGLRQYTDAIVNRGWSEGEVRRSLRESPEYRERARHGYYRSGSEYGYGYNARAELIVRRAYRDALGREPDPSGMREYTRRVVRDGWTERDVERAIRASYEYRRDR